MGDAATNDDPVNCTLKSVHWPTSAFKRQLEDEHTSKDSEGGGEDDAGELHGAFDRLKVV